MEYKQDDNPEGVKTSNTAAASLPTIDMTPLLLKEDDPQFSAEAVEQTAKDIYTACTEFGFFYIKNHGVDAELETKLEAYARKFFTKPLELKQRIVMERGGRAWRGYFKVGDELTSGRPDLKEGLYYGGNLEPILHIPMHGPNLHTATGPFAEGIHSTEEELAAEQLTDIEPQFTTDLDAPPSAVKAFEEYRQRHTTEEDKMLAEIVEQWLEQMKTLGYRLMEGIARSLKLKPNYFEEHFMRDPLCLFRIFNYPNPQPLQDSYNKTGKLATSSDADTAAVETQSPPEQPNANVKLWSVGEHTDYGMITILRQDSSGGLQVRKVPKGPSTSNKSSSSADDDIDDWIEAPPIPGTFVINLGDMLEKMTGGLYLSTPHRVLNPAARDRISFPFFFDPDFSAKMTSLVSASPLLTSVLGNCEAAELQATQATQSENGGTQVAPSSLKGRAFRRRWDGKEVGLTSFDGTYGEYIISKVSKVFPHLVKGRIE